MSIPQQTITLRPREFRGENWVPQAAFWARAVGVVSLLAAGAVLLPADWRTFLIPVQIWIAIAWAAPAPILILLSFFLRKWHGFPCITIGILALISAADVLLAPLMDSHNYDAMEWYYLLATALAAGNGILAYCAYWAYRWLLNPISAHDRRRGFEILPSAHSIASDRLK